MKIYLCIVCIFLTLVLAKSDVSPEIKKLFDECKKEVGITESQGSRHSDDPKEKCYEACILEKLKFMVDSKIIVDKVIENLAKYSVGDISDNMKTNVTECANKANVEKDKCDVAGVYQKCMMTFFKRELEAERDEIDKLLSECKKEIGVSEDVKALEDNDPKKWCIGACMIKKKGGIIDGKAVAEKVTETFCKETRRKATDSVKTTITGCVDEANKSEDECQVFKELFKCIHTKLLRD